MKLVLAAALILFSSQCSSAQPGRAYNYNNGAYYAADGTKREGLIAFVDGSQSPFAEHPERAISFKASKDARPEQINASKVKALILMHPDKLAADSFVVMHSIHPSHQMMEYDFVKVLYDKGPVNLYDYAAKPDSRKGGIPEPRFMADLDEAHTHHFYFYGKVADSTTEMRPKDFKNVMGKMLAADTATVSSIMSGKYTLFSMQKMMKQYYFNVAMADTLKSIKK
jgi:hypothetical protein